MGRRGARRARPPRRARPRARVVDVVDRARAVRMRHAIDSDPVLVLSRHRAWLARAHVRVRVYNLVYAST